MKSRTALTESVRRHLPTITIGAILLLAAFMRLYRIGSIPPGLHPDEAANGLDIFRMFDHHDFRVLYDTNGPREALFIYLQAVFVGILGNTATALRLAPAIIGTLGVGATYLWAKEFFGLRVAVFAAFIMAVLPWAVTLSRDGFRASMMMLMVPLTLWLYGRALASGRRVWFILAGVALGLGFYTYIAFRLFPLILVVGLFYAAIWRRGWLQGRAKSIAISVAATAIVLLPLGVYGVQHPHDLVARTDATGIMNTKLDHGHPLETFGASVAQTALMFNIRGDENYRHNLGGEPELNIFVGAMFILGLLIAVTMATRLSYALLLATFVIMLLPAVLSAEHLPHALRSSGAIAPTAVLAALGMRYLLDRWNNVFPINSAARSVGSAALVVLLALSAIQGYVQYFVAYANAPQTRLAYREETTAMAEQINAQHFSGTVYVVMGSYDAKPIEYLTHYHSTYVRVSANVIPTLPKQTRTIEFVIPESNKDAAVRAIRFKYPTVSVMPFYSSYDPTQELFVIYRVPAGA